MSTRDHLDDVIDQVARRLTRVDEDAQFASRLVATLPVRLTWFGWLTHAWAPRLAMMALIAGSLVLWSARRTTEVAPSASLLASVATTNWPQLAKGVEPRTVGTLGTLRTRPLEPVALMEPVEPFDGLPSLPVEASLDVPSLSIADLPLTVESFSPQD